MRTIAIVCSLVLTLWSSGSTQVSAQGGAAERKPPSNDAVATLLTASAIRAQLMKMTEDRPTQEYTIVERIGAYRLSIEHRKLPQRPAVHEQEAEMWTVIEGNATITTGGKIEGAAAPTAGTATQAPGNVFGKMIVGGTLNRVGPGDFLLVPEGVPHQITEASPTLKFIVFEITRPKTGAKNY
jgi:mannose-6-phosphate isomerase-like protein (cupin superfamily)